MRSIDHIVGLFFLCISSSVLAGPREKFQQLLHQSLEQNQLIRGAVLSVHAPSQHLYWVGASGLADPGIGIKLTPRDPFLIHSVSKLFTATLILQLHEQRRLRLSDRIGKYLPCSSIKGLHVVDDHDYSCEITIDQLGHHTSGLADYTTDGKADENGMSPFLKLAFSDTDKQWWPHEIISYTRDHLHAHFIPGNGWHYSDLNFLLLGMIVEKVTGQKLHDMYACNIYMPLGMRHTWMPFRERHHTSKWLAHSFFGNLDYTNMRTMTAGWGAGGLASTLGDLDKFMRALVKGRIFRDPNTGKLMRSWVSTTIPGVQYGFGMYRSVGKFGEVIGHTGMNGSFANYWVEHDVSISGSLGQVKSNSQQLISAVMKELSNEVE